MKYFKFESFHSRKCVCVCVCVYKSMPRTCKILLLNEINTISEVRFGVRSSPSLYENDTMISTYYDLQHSGVILFIIDRLLLGLQWYALIWSNLRLIFTFHLSSDVHAGWQLARQSLSSPLTPLTHCLLAMIRRLSHWARATHICVSKLPTIGSDNGLSPGQRQAIIWTNAGILLIGPLWISFSDFFIEIATFSFKKIRFKVSSAKYRPCRRGLNLLTPSPLICAMACRLLGTNTLSKPMQILQYNGIQWDMSYTINISLHSNAFNFICEYLFRPECVNYFIVISYECPWLTHFIIIC